MENEPKNNSSKPTVDEEVDEAGVDKNQYILDFLLCVVISVVGLALPFFFTGVPIFFLPLCIALFFFIAYKADKIQFKQAHDKEDIIARLEEQRKEQQAQNEALLKKIEELELELQTKE